MKVFLISAVAVVAIAFGAAAVLNEQFQMDSKAAFTTEGVRLSTDEVGTASN
jgi:hypothetical protein